MPERLPPMAALRAFEATIRAGSVTKASQELSVTNAAISQQLRILEDHLGIALLDRSGRKMEPTKAGRMLGNELITAFQKMRDGIRFVRNEVTSMPLRISTTPSFAANWLVPRLHSFAKKNPNIELTITGQCSLVDLEGGGFDAAIRFGTKPPEEMESFLVVPTKLGVIGAPSLVGENPDLTPEDLFRFTWLLEPNKEILMRWLTDLGLDPESHRNRLTIEGAMHYSALLAGQGVSLMGIELARQDTKSGRLKVLFDNIDNREGTGYYLAWLPRFERPALRQFAKWLASEVESDRKDGQIQHANGKSDPGGPVTNL